MTPPQPASRQSAPRLLLVTGMSGAGKSTVLDALEDMGWDTVENLPASMLKAYVDEGRGGGRQVPVAVGMDARSRGFDPLALPGILRSIDGVQPEILYLDCSGAELIRRYGETRRRHPLALDRPPEDGIARERAITAPLRNIAEGILDTTDLSPTELRDELRRRFGGDVAQPVLTIASFGFARGISRTADLVFDLRFLANPHWVDELRPLTGEDPRIREYIERDEAWNGTMDRLEALLIDLVPRYWAAGKTYVTVAFGCTGGRHRSVCAAVEMDQRLRRAGFSPNLRHRDLSSQPSDGLEGRPGHTTHENSESETRS